MPRLFASALLARMPQGMASLAILLLVRDSTHSYAAAGLAVGRLRAGHGGDGPGAGQADRSPRALPGAGPGGDQAERVLILLVLAAHWGAGAGVLVGLAGLAGALVPSIAPTVRALLNEIIHEPRVRESAYSLEAVVQEIIWILGPFVVALIVAVTTPSAALLLNAAICVTGTVSFVRSPAAARAPVPSEHRDPGAVLSSRPLRALLGPIALMGFSLGAIEVGLPSLALHAGSRADSGILLALWSVGSMLGGLWFGSRMWRSPLPVRYRNLLVAAVALTAPLIVARSIPVGALCAVLAGLAIAPLFSCQYAMVARTVTEGNETEAFTWVASALVSGIAAGSAAAGAVISSGGVAAPFVLGSLATVLAALTALASRHRVIQLA